MKILINQFIRSKRCVVNLGFLSHTHRHELYIYIYAVNLLRTRTWLMRSLLVYTIIALFFPVNSSLLCLIHAPNGSGSYVILGRLGSLHFKLVPSWFTFVRRLRTVNRVRMSRFGNCILCSLPQPRFICTPLFVSFSSSELRDLVCCSHWQ